MRKIGSWHGLLLTITLLPLSCNFREEKVTTNPVSTAKFARIQEQILGPKCASCHSGPGAADGVDLSSYVAILRSGVVTPSRPEQSSLYQSVVNKRMPKGREPLSEAELSLIREWIEEGAHETEVPGTEPTGPQPTHRWLAKHLFETRCVVCHNVEKPRGKVNLASYDGLLASTGHDYKAVVPGDPDKSGIYLELAAQTMPPEPKKLTALDVEALRGWIANGALEFTPGSPAPVPGEPQPTFEWLSKNVLGRRCGSCHGIPYRVAKVDFTSYATLMASPGETARPVTPGDPSRSTIYLEVVLGHMPPKRRSVSAEELSAVRQWIQAGALRE